MSASFITHSDAIIVISHAHWLSREAIITDYYEMMMAGSKVKPFWFNGASVPVTHSKPRSSLVEVSVCSMRYLHTLTSVTPVGFIAFTSFHLSLSLSLHQQIDLNVIFCCQLWLFPLMPTAMGEERSFERNKRRQQ